ncbi:response regulator transcription factor [Clostridium sardiniense]|uniref:Stage 0 sporulation protein A homolog n=1 Tax=Clostridium sardiniense TaxID=29369 RepID=A0ABS7KUE4_CLOSR|nr:response regulator transcription factor [Clostridium sardiniense]MBY0754434.1 response regulator transcription factor [Clostridium sardiniense]MDQ0461311.1 DNA-binding response OmpR family regulator [Clostridium sardiniense]
MRENILIVDDEFKILEVVKIYLEKEGYIVYTAGNGIDALKIFEKNNIDLLVLDLMLPDISGEEVCEKIRELSDVPIIMLTAKCDEDNILNGFNIGTDDYITKPFSPKQLVARVNAVLKRCGNLNENKLVFRNGDLIIDVDKFEVTKDNKIVNLTASEFKILLELSRNPKKVFTRSELIDKVIGEENYVYDRIIDSHIKNIRAKIEDGSKGNKYIITVHGIGYKFGGE